MNGVAYSKNIIRYPYQGTLIPFAGVLFELIVSPVILFEEKYLYQLIIRYDLKYGKFFL
jgi:hypothetical protein